MNGEKQKKGQQDTKEYQNPLSLLGNADYIGIEIQERESLRKVCGGTKVGSGFRRRTNKGMN